MLVLGGKGFIGRHAVAAFNALNIGVEIGTRSPGPQPGLNGEREIRLEKMQSPEDWTELVREFDVVLNCVGILRNQHGACYGDVHHRAPYALAKAAEGKPLRLVHVSAIGLERNDRSRFLTSKLRGENALRSTAADWVIARPSLLDGEGGFGAVWLRGVARLPFFFVPSGANGKISALTATDLGEALTRLCLATADELMLSQSREFELGGPREYDFESYMRALRTRHSNSRALAIRVPSLAARLFAHFCDLIHFTPFSFGHWELLRKDNLAEPNRLPELLGRPASEVVDGVDSQQAPSKAQ